MICIQLILLIPVNLKLILRVYKRTLSVFIKKKKIKYIFLRPMFFISIQDMVMQVPLIHVR